MLRDYVRRWLGLDDIQEYQIRSDNQTREAIADLNANLGKINKLLGTVIPGIGRIITKLDPIYAKSEHDPERMAESDRLGEAVLNRLANEELARKHTLGEL